MTKIYTIGFTKKNAEQFFTKLTENNISQVVDVRLNNTSQLAGFTKFPDIVFFLDRICQISYKHELLFSPEEETLSRYKKKKIDWDTYVSEFAETMKKRNIEEYISRNYNEADNFCLLCSEAEPNRCHRSLIAKLFCNVFKDVEIINL